MAQQIVRHFKILVYGYFAFVPAKEAGLYLFGSVTVRAGFTHSTVNDHGGGETPHNIAGQISRTVCRFS